MSKRINPELSIGDRIVCLEMEDEPRYFGAKGTVTDINTGPKFIQYSIKWDDGGSLFLLDTDSWILEKDFKRKPKINEETNVNELAENSKILKYFKMLEIKKYLDLLREASIVNMFGSSPYLYIGGNILKKEHYNYEGEDFEELIELAENSRNIMIRGAMNMLEDEGKEVTPENVNKIIRRYAPKILTFWMTHY